MREVRGWSLKWQAIGVVAVFCLSTWLTITTVSYVGSRTLVSDTVQLVRDLEHAYADLLSESQLSTAAFVEQIEQLESMGQQQEQAIEDLTQLRETMHRQLASRERQLLTLTEQRDRARKTLASLEWAIARTEVDLQNVSQHRADLKSRLESAETEALEVARQRDAGRRMEAGLRWQVARLEGELVSLRERRETARVWLKDWVLSSVEGLEQVFDSTGIDIERLVARAVEPGVGQGGPLEVASLAPITSAPIPAPDASMSGNIQRLAALQRLARRLPLASPLDHFSITSAFGKRRDPFTGGLAFHAGLDLGAASGTAILATAPGRVVQAGSSGPYGTMVEIDHGMGIITRYGHLKSIEVEVGDEIEFRQEIGVIGSTGRSTGTHLHYEVRVDDLSYDPSKFLDAGRFLVGVFDVARNIEANPG